MKNWAIPLVSIIILAYFGYMIGQGIILPRCYGNDALPTLPNDTSAEDCQRMVNQILINYQIQGVIYGALAGLIVGLGINFIVKKIKK